MDPDYEYVEDSEETGDGLHDDPLDFHGDFLRCLDPTIVNVICRY